MLDTTLCLLTDLTSQVARDREWNREEESPEEENKRRREREREGLDDASPPHCPGLEEAPGTTTTSIPAKAFLNRLIFLSQLFSPRDGGVLKESFIKKMQQSSEFLAEIRDKIETGQKVEDFVIRNEVLYKVTKVENTHRVQLCLPDEIFRSVCDGIHAAGYHYRALNMKAFLKQFYFSQNSNREVANSEAGCTVCLYSMKCRRRVFTQPFDSQDVYIGTTYHADFLESLPLSRLGHRYMLVVTEAVTGYSMFFATKSTNSSEAIGVMNNIIRTLGRFKYLVTDFGAAFTSAQFKEFMEQNDIVNLKETPSRSAGNGKAEVVVKLVQHLLASFLFHNNLDFVHWSDPRVLNEVTTLFNSMIIHYGKNEASRSFLHFGALKYRPPQMLCSPDTGSQEELEVVRMSNLQRLIESRHNFLEKYQGLDPGKFPVGSLVVVPLSKTDRMRKLGNSGTTVPVDNVFRVVEQNKAGLRLESLLTGDGRTVSLGNVRPIPADTLQYVRKQFPLVAPNNPFHRNIYSKGAGPLFELIHDKAEIPLSLQDQASGETSGDLPGEGPGETTKGEKRTVEKAIREEEQRVEEELAKEEDKEDTTEREAEKQQTDWQTESLRKKWNLRPNRRINYRNLARGVMLTRRMKNKKKKTKHQRSQAALQTSLTKTKQKTKYKVTFNPDVTVATCNIDKGPGEKEGEVVRVGYTDMSDHFHTPCLFFTPWVVKGESSREISLLQEVDERDEFLAGKGNTNDGRKRLAQTALTNILKNN